ncbi:MAG: hypothetical protein LBP59_18850 [Planctomycetaceae bacterium]|jgi:hypothetical protein|nr:hypothetical protein [Planctomycetaceae bacterium]
MLSSRQAQGATAYARTIIEDFKSSSAWQNASATVIQTIDDVERYMVEHSNRITGYVINVDFALSTKPIFKMVRWRRFV